MKAEQVIALRIDIVTAVRNEEQCLAPFVAAVQALSLPADTELHLLFVEDSSTDATLSVLRELSASHASVAFFSLEKGYGQCPALVFGMTRSTADAVIMMDVDEGHPVELIPKMVNCFMEGAEVVQAVREELQNRQVYRNIGAKAFNMAMRLLTGINLDNQNVYYRLVSRRVKDMIIRNRRWHRFLRLNFRGSNAPATSRIQFTARERQMGQSKYGFRRLLAFSLDGLLSLIPVTRGALLLGLLAGAAVILRSVAHGLLSILLAAVMVFVTVLYSRVVRNANVSRMRVREQAV